MYGDIISVGVRVIAHFCVWAHFTVTHCVYATVTPRPMSAKSDLLFKICFFTISGTM